MMEKSTGAKLDRIFEEISNLISSASRIPLTDKVIIEESDLVELLDDLKIAIPTEVQTAGRLLEEQKDIIIKAHEDADNIVMQAKNEAERIVEKAKSEAEQLMRQEEIVKNAQEYSEELKAEAAHYQQVVKEEADTYAGRVKMDVLQYADDMLAYLEGNLKSALEGIKDNRTSINSERYSLTQSERDAAEELDNSEINKEEN